MAGLRRRRVMKEIAEILRHGDVVNFEARGKGFFMKFIYRQFQRAQRKKFGKKSRYKDIHSVLVLDFKEDGVPIVLSVTVPKAVVEPLSISKRTRKITVCRLKGSGEGFSDEWVHTMRKAAMELAGRKYDYLQALAIKLKLQRWPKWITCWLDLGKKRTVCSGGVQYCLLKAWKKWIEPFEPLSNVVQTTISRPLNGTLPSETYPAHYVNDNSFEIVKEIKLKCLCTSER